MSALDRARDPSPIWVLVVGLFVVGDLATTVIGLDIVGVVETHPVGEAFASDPILMLALKMGMMLLAYGFSLIASERLSWLFPAVLAVVGGFLTTWNLVTIATALA
jgi:hypothetical protein